MPLEGYVTILGVLLVALALVVYLIAIIMVLREINQQLDVVIGAVLKIVHQTRPVELVVVAIATDLTAGKNVLVGLLESKVGKAGAANAMANALGPAAAASTTAPPPPTGEAPTPQAGRLTPTTAEFPGVAPAAAPTAVAPAAPAPAPAAAEEAPAAPVLKPTSASFPAVAPGPPPAAPPPDDEPPPDEPARIVYRRTT